MKFVRVDHTYVTPSKIVCVGRNYIDHISELKNEILYLGIHQNHQFVFG